jgi:hypothetical protein
MSESSINNGKMFEDHIKQILSNNNIGYKINNNYGVSAIGGTMRLDIICDNGLVIECKYQGDMGGTLFQKWWYTLIGLNNSPSSAVIVIGFHENQKGLVEKAIKGMKKSCAPHVKVMTDKEFENGFCS